MESPKRVVVKSLTWQLTGLVSMTLLGVLTTGSWSFAGSFALGSAGIGLIMYILHERLWAGVTWGRTESGIASRATDKAT